MPHTDLNDWLDGIHKIRKGVLKRMEELTTIGRPIQQVFGFVTDQSTARLYKPFVTESRKITDGPIGAGTRFVEGFDFSGRHYSGVVEILEYRPFEWYVYRTRAEPYPYSLYVQMAFDAVPGGTRLRGQVDFLGRGAGRLIIPLVRLFFRSQQAGAFARLKAVLESPEYAGDAQRAQSPRG